MCLAGTENATHAWGRARRDCLFFNKNSGQSTTWRGSATVRGFRTDVRFMNFHESYAGDGAKLPSERSTGLVFAAVALVIATSWRHSPVVFWVALGLAVGLVTISLIAPVLLKPLNIVWFQFGLRLHQIVNPIVMFAVFAVVFVPAGAIMRLRYDPLRLRREPMASSYWIDRRRSGNTTESMTNQF